MGKQLLLSWFDFVHKTPTSFPMLKSGKLAGQKNFNAQSKELCVEVMDEEIEAIHKHSRFLHIHLAKIQKLDDKPIALNEKKNDDTDDKNTDEKKEDADKKEESNESSNNIWKEGNYTISYWPFDHHLRIIYS